MSSVAIAVAIVNTTIASVSVFIVYTIHCPQCAFCAISPSRTSKFFQPNVYRIIANVVYDASVATVASAAIAALASALGQIYLELILSILCKQLLFSMIFLTNYNDRAARPMKSIQSENDRSDRCVGLQHKCQLLDHFRYVLLCLLSHWTTFSHRVNITPSFDVLIANIEHFMQKKPIFP